MARRKQRPSMTTPTRDESGRRARPRVLYGPVARGQIVRLRDNQGHLTNNRAIVLKKARADNFSRAYGPEVIVCELYSDSKEQWKIARDAELEGRHDAAARIYEDSVSIDSKQVGMLDPIGRVKKIPRGCIVAAKKVK